MGNHHTMLSIYVLIIFHSVECARILGVQHVAAYSHNVLFNTLLKELAHRGHDVTVISTFEEKTPLQNFKIILMEEIIGSMEGIIPHILQTDKLNAITRNLYYERAGLKLTEDTLIHPKVQKLLKSNETFDTVILQQFLNEAFRGFCYHYNAHCVTVSSYVAGRWTNPHVGNPGPPSVVPEILHHFTNQMDFLERLYNTAIYVVNGALSQLYFLPKQNELLQQYFPEAPNVYELMYNTSLMLVNSHISINYATVSVPNMIEIGGFHVQPSKTLPKDLKKFLDSATDGAIYFSMGSYLTTELLPENVQQDILHEFSKLNQKVLLKWHNGSATKHSSKFLTRTWFPQNDVLAHPNIKLFVTHGGILSTIEAVYHGVPLLCIPIFSDQLLNSANAAKAGYAVTLPRKDFTSETFEKALLEVLQNPKYTINVKKRSRIFHHRPLKPLDTAMFWIEYLLQHGSEHLKTSGLNLKWYQYFLLDVLVVFIICFCVMIAIFWIVLRTLISNKKNILKNKKNS